MSMNKSQIKQTREQRLAAKLKENLRRRKTQIRARNADESAEPPQDKPDPQR